MLTPSECRRLAPYVRKYPAKHGYSYFNDIVIENTVTAAARVVEKGARYALKRG